MLKTRESKKSDLSSPSSIFVHLNSNFSCFLSNARTLWMCWDGRVIHVIRMCPQPSCAGASGIAWGGTGENVNLISTPSCHRISPCCWWATASVPRGQGQGIAAGSDLHQPPGAVPGFSPQGTSDACGRAQLEVQHPQQPPSCRPRCVLLGSWNLEQVVLVVAAVFNLWLRAWQEMHHFSPLHVASRLWRANVLWEV